MSPARALARLGWTGAFTLAVLLAPAAAAAAREGYADIPEYHGYVNDAAGVIPEERRAQLEAFLDQFTRRTGAQFAVLTVGSTAPEDPGEYKVRVFEKWGIGAKGQDNGLLLLLAMKEHRIVFETGYGLEGTLPDGWQASMLRDLAVPRLRQGDVPGAVTAAVLAAAQRVAAAKGVKLEWNGQELRYDRRERRRMPEWALLLLLFILFTVFSSVFGRRSYRRRGGWMGPWIGGGWGGGSGGWGGGGGASFGGFGGGMSGGGGGGASW